MDAFLAETKVADLCAETGYSQTAVYTWIRRYRNGGMEALMGQDDNDDGGMAPVDTVSGAGAGSETIGHVA